MDDFGTGTSSLSLLKDYPFDTIKIDRSFVQDLVANRDVLAVTHATVALISNLGMASLAEGIEDRAQVSVLQSLGCRYGQGFFFSRAVRADRLLDALASHRERELAA
jgi:EAL domain-containing protein (putative c-di-GMP-specific phosphodiesterase class I)